MTFSELYKKKKKQLETNKNITSLTSQNTYMHGKSREWVEAGMVDNTTT